MLSRLQLSEPLFVQHVVAPPELARLLPLGKTWLEKSQPPRLDYESVLELVAETSRSHPDPVRRLNVDNKRKGKAKIGVSRDDPDLYLLPRW